VVRLLRTAPEKEIEFYALYGSNGVWNEVCGKSAAYLGGSLTRLAGSETFYERLDIWRSEWDWKEFRELHRAERKKIAGFAETEGIVLSERIVEMFYDSQSGPDDDGMLTPA
jgi:hypothetical protein